MLRILRAIVLYIVFMFVTVLVVVWVMPDAPPLLQLALFFGVPAWLVRRSMRARAAPDKVASPAAPAAHIRQRDPETLEEFEQARGQEPTLRWVAKARTDGRADKASPRPEPDPRPAACRVSAGKPAKGGWVPHGDQIVVAGQSIGGMVYAGAPSGKAVESRAWIDPALPARASGRDRAGEDLPYWPSYAAIPPRSRATYLDWLAGGRASADYDVGYMFLYFYGLERRFLCDDPADEERRLIRAEVSRLMALYPDSGSARRYLGEFLQLASCMMDDAGTTLPSVEGGWDLPLALRFALGRRIGAGEPLDAQWLLAWLKAHPEGNLRTPARRCAAEFDVLFQILFDRRFPQGLQVRAPRKALSMTYRAASGEFDFEFTPKVGGRAVPDITGAHKPIEIAQEIAEEACEALDKFSRYLGRKPEGRGSLEAQALLPLELATAFPSDQLDALRDWAGHIVADDGLVVVSALLSRIEGQVGPKLARRQLTDAADALARIGFGLAPDPRFALRAPRLDEPVVLFALPQPVARLEDVGDEFRNGLLQIALGCIVAQADGQVSPDEERALRAQLAEMAGLTEVERVRLRANLDWFLAVPPDMAQLRGRMKEVGTGQEESLRRAVVSVTHADGAVAAAEVAGVERIYRALGLDAAHVYSDLHAGNAPDEPVRVRHADPAAETEAIPPERPGSRLDPERIAAIRADTDRASAVLGQIFAAEPEVIVPLATDAPRALPGLDPRLTALLRELIGSESWSKTEFSDLVQRHGLMPAGALEALNEWAWNCHDEALIEEYDGYEISATLIEQIKADLTGKEM